MSTLGEIHTDRRFTQEEFDRFAALSWDDNPIHVDPNFARTTRFGGTVAHGLMLVGALLALAGRLRPGARVVAHDVMFPDPTFTGEDVRFTAKVLKENANGVEVVLEARSLGRDVVTCTGTCTLAR